ncbi:DNA replication terminus site-binding protein [Endozoicomonas gorgoniicola]|uniref:DNA replication terminus site-binding protein n=1 Tax=Endozoicomonas gorgoniicola TaxID=1234144 RepID=A0ABT3MSJ5_9GAMM|nr:DNA replication terminus site-binding protein [Endozoicomonas gorgoniicola]MCW7552352.1 DNA replication terminus site-binding protein [Endozoicomonas gorgoniicola]
MSRKTAARMAVRDTLIELVDINRQFREAVLNDHDLPAWVMQEDDTDALNDRTLAASVTTRLTYSSEQNKQETARLPGVIGISARSLVQGQQLNQAKDRFKAAMGEYRKLYGDDIAAIEETSDQLRDGMLGGLQIQHIHFVQSYRQLKLFQQPPRRISFSWAANHSGTVRLTSVEAIEHLRKKYMASAAIERDITLLEQLPGSEIVVIKRLLAPHLRANLKWPDTIEAERQMNPESKKQFPGQINTPIPVFVQLEKGQPLPDFKPIKPFDPMTRQERLQRSDARLVRISDNPVSRIYRYA